MPLDPSKLRKARPTPDGGYIAQCPACFEAGNDTTGNHIRIWNDGRFACVANPGNHTHRSRVWELCGDPTAKRDSIGRVLTRLRKESKLREQAALSRVRILKKLWSPEEILAASPASIPTNETDQALAVIGLFQPRDIVWIGDKWDSGKQRHACHFKRAFEWTRNRVLPGPLACSCTFLPGVIARAARTVKVRRFLVIESDTLPYPQQGAVFRYVQECGLRLRAVVNTAGRSLHGWFDAPPQRVVSDLHAFLPEIGADPATFNPPQPFRLPGWPRADTGKIPTLIYLDP